MAINMERLVSSEANYHKQIGKTIENIAQETDQENILRNLVLFCKQVFASNANQRKKYLCLLLLKDIFENVNSDYFRKLADQYLALKLYNMVQSHIESRNRESRTGTQDKETTQRTYSFALETIVFWAKRLSFMPKSSFCQVYDEIKKLGIEFPQQFSFYKKDMLINLWNSDHQERLELQQTNPIIQQLNKRFQVCKEQLEATINESVLNDEEILVKPIIQKLREFLIYFFSNYKALENEESRDRDIIIVCFHIMNNLYKKICSRIYISIQEIVGLIKDVFEATYPPEYDSVDRMDIIQLAGVFKYNALTIFQRIHQRIEKQDALLGPFKLSLNLEPNEPLKLGSLQKSRTLHNSITKIAPKNKAN